MLAERMRTKAAPPRRKAPRALRRAPTRAPRRGSGRAGARRRSEEVRQRRLDLAGLGLPGARASTSASSSTWAGTAARSATAPRPRSPTRSARSPSSSRRLPVRQGSALILQADAAAPLDALAAGVIAIVGGRAARFSRPQTAGLGPDQPVRKELFDPHFFTRARRRRSASPLLGLDHALPADRRPHHRRLLVVAGVAAGLGPLGLRPARGRAAAASSAPATAPASSRPRCARRGSPTRTWSRPSPRTPSRSSAAGGGGRGAGRDPREAEEDEADDATVANFDESVRVADERAQQRWNPSPPRPRRSPRSRRARRRSRSSAPRWARSAQGGITESEEIDYVAPSDGAARAGQARQGARAPRTTRRSARRCSRRSATSASRRRSSASSSARTSAATSCASRPGPRSPRSPSSRTTSPTRSPPPTSASSPRSPASRRSASRSPTSAAAWSASATSTAAARQGSTPLVAWLGKDIAGHAVWTDLQKMPHVLVAGTTGSGKSGCVNAILSSTPAARLAERGAAGAGRPEAGRAEPLRADPAPADAGRHLAAARRQRAHQPDRRDGEPLRGDGRGPRAQPRRAQPGPRRAPARRRCRTSSA